MSNIPTYNADENLRRIKMQRQLKFIVVEGSDDLPIYESCIQSLLKTDSPEYDVIFAGGKGKIKDFAISNACKNAMFIIDKDFNDLELDDERIISLNRYSIENYFINNDVIAHALKFVFNCKLQDAKEIFSIEEYLEEMSSSLRDLIVVLFYYQRKYSKVLHARGVEVVAWGDSFLCQDHDWKLCREKINKLITSLSDGNFTIDEAKVYYGENFTPSESVAFDFPGKMLKTSLQRYIRQKILEIKPGAGGKFNNAEEVRTQLSLSIHYSQELATALTPALRFITA
ncbi:DUF4435 domain-containing protein [Aeromonas dhakensis]|uniref:DUF4435 domain-containing protein n=1 Tax=Aeromonas dhakensis TaxID=196024 RepID=UPI001CF041EA|nr:DUF4435 domain-containing protein [Aeromonas dhakensis]UCM52187.1 DUF4435 domain-containing protein [Aeromonas dhakensis]